MIAQGPVLADALQDLRGTQVAGHDEDGVAEIHRAALGVRDPAVVQDLQEDVEHVGMGLFHLIEQDDGVGFAPHSLGELAALLIAHISRRGTDETGDGELFHVLGHVDAHQVLFVVKERLGQALGQLRLAHARGAQEQEGTDGPVLVGHAGPGAQDRLGHPVHSLVLADDPLMEHLGQPEELVALRLHQLADGDPRPTGHDTGDLLLGDLVPQKAVLLGGGLFRLGQFRLEGGQLTVFQLGGVVQVVVPLRGLDLGIDRLQTLPELLDLADLLFLVLPDGVHPGELLPHRGELLPKSLQTLLAHGIALLLQGDFLDLALHDAAADIVHLRGHGLHLGTDHGAGLVHQVDGLVRQETVRDVAGGEGGRRDQRRVGDAHAVEHLIPLLQAAQDGDAVLDGGLIHQHRLETALQGRVLLDILAVLVQGGGADAVELAPGQHGLEQVAGVHAALGLPRANDGVHLIDEQDDAAVALFDLIEHRLEPLLEFAAVLGPGDQGAHVQGEDGAVLQGVGHIALDDPLGQALGDGRLAHAGLTDEDRVVLGLPGQDADHVPDLAVTPDDRVKLVFPGPFHQVGAVFLQGVVGVLRIVAGHPAGAADFRQGREELFPGDVHVPEDLFHRRVRVGDQGQEQVLHGDVLVLHAAHLLGGAVQGLVHIRGHVELAFLPAGKAHLRQRVQGLLGTGTHILGRAPHLFDHLGDQPLVVLQEGREKVDLFQLLVAPLQRQGLGPLDGLHALLGVCILAHGITSFRYSASKKSDFL